MKKKLSLFCALALVVSSLAGCSSGGSTGATTAADTTAAETTAAQSAASQEELDKAAADEVAAMIDAIYVQERTDKTDEQCAAAKAGWDALTDAQKELVEGENADPDYFGRDTGDASLDDAGNEDGIGINELLVVSFGTSFNDSRVEDIHGVEKYLAVKYPEWSVRRAFTAQIIINHVQARDGEFIDNMDQALERAVANGVRNLIIQPTHLMHGAEYDELVGAVENYKDKFAHVVVAEPLLGEVGTDASVINADKQAVAEAVVAEAVETAGYETAAEAAADSTAIVLMGHGTAHTAKVTYSQMQTQMGKLGYDNVFIGTVEGEPEETACEAVIEAVAEAGYKKVILRPLMVVAGDHANNDMAGDDEDSWKSMFTASGKFDIIDTQIEGLGRIQAVKDIYAAHTAAAIDALEDEKTEEEMAQDAVDIAGELIDKIYVQQRDDLTDALCAAAKEAWDALSDEQKEQVSGENADPDYFGRDTGDASKDDPANADEIGEKELLVVSFGTSFNDSRVADIASIEKALAKAYPDWSVRRAFTAQIIINHIQARENEFIDNMDQALERAVANGVKTLVVQPTHLMHGAEYDELVEALDGYKDKIDTIVVAEPLLGEVGADATVINADKQAVAEAVTQAAAKDAGYADVAAAAADSTAIVLMGHGTAHNAKVTYSQMQTQMQTLGYDNVFIGTVEGEPEETACDAVIEAVAEAGYKNVILRPLMVVAGDHANNDMAGDDDDSWKSMFTAAGKFDKIEAQISGLGRIEAVQELYKAHTAAAIESLDEAEKTAASEATDTMEGVTFDDKANYPKDGVYEVYFNTDSSMFGVNEAYDGKGILTVKDGKQVLHVTLKSQSIVNLFVGKADDAKKDGAELLQPTTDSVKYPDGTTDTAYGFDIPVEEIGKDFDLALIGKKGTWYDHTVSVTWEAK